ncbi:MAG: MFS transporter [Anaerolineae bacterium]|jgi:MFS family permease
MTTLRARLAGWRSLPGDVRRLLTIGLLFALGYNGVGLMLRPLYVLRLGLGAGHYGLYAAAGSFAYMLASLVAGWLGMHLGERRTMLVGAFGCLAGSALMPMVEWFDPAWWRPLPIVSNVVLSVFWALAIVPMVPALIGLTDEALRERIIGLSSTLNGLGILAGNLVGGLLPRAFSSLLGSSTTTNAGFRLAISVVLLSGAALTVLLWCLPDRPAVERQATVTQAPLALPLLLLIGLFSMLIQTAPAAMATFASPYLSQDLQLSTEAIGLVTTAGQALAVFGMGITPWVARRVTSRRGTIWVGLGASVALLPMAAIPHWLAAVASRIALGVFNMMRMPLMQMFAMAQVPQSRRSLMSGILLTGGGLCLTLVGYLGGQVAAVHGYRAVFWISSAVTAVAVALFAATTRALIAHGLLERA